MNRALLIISLSALSTNAFSEGICSFTKQENEFFEFTESYPFSDKDYSQQSVTKSKQRLEAHKAGKEVPYYIHENAVNIIKGGELQVAMYAAKKEYESYVPLKGKGWDRTEHDLKHKYLSARKSYCDFRRGHYAIDW